MNHPEIREMKFTRTKNIQGEENGWVIEVIKKGVLTVAYQTVVYPTPDPERPVVKGYHCYRYQTNQLTCVAGFVTIRVYWDKQRKVDYKLAEHRPVCLTIPPGNPYAILNEHNEFARVINHPKPLWDEEKFQDDQYLWEPSRELDEMNGEIVDLSEFTANKELP